MAADYLVVVEGDVPSSAVERRPARSPWDPRHAAVMTERGLPVEEEALAEMLGNDVAAGHRPADSLRPEL